MNVIAQSYLTCIDGSHNKQYLARVVERPDGSYETPCYYGAIGARLSVTVKYQGNDRRKAEQAFAKVITEKRGKGYVDRAIPSGLPLPTGAAPLSTSVPGPALATAASGVPRFGAQLAGDGGADTLGRATLYPASYRVEEKWDGFRALITFSPDGTIAIRNRNGEDKGRIANTPLLEAALRTLGDTVPALWEGSVIDGELVGPSFEETISLLGSGGRASRDLRFVAFDLPYFAGVDRRSRPLRERLHDLELVLDRVVPPIELAVGLAPTIDLADAIWDSGGEGLIIKDLESPYLAGNRSAWTKVKQVETADAVVMGFEPGKGKYAGQPGALILGQYDTSGTLVEISRVSGFTDELRTSLDGGFIGTVVEFAYQARTSGGRYRHPRFVRIRADKAPADCTLSL